jgi:hypothetical protein
MKIKLTQTTIKYFIVTAVADTVLTVYGGTDYTLISAAISAISYSTQKAPLGFPTSPIKWTIDVVDTTIRSQASPTADAWYNLGTLSITIPIGCWDVTYKAAAESEKTSTTTLTVAITLSTANNSESNANFTRTMEYVGASGTVRTYCAAYAKDCMILTSKTVYYLNERAYAGISAGTLWLRSDNEKTLIRAVCAYL